MLLKVSTVEKTGVDSERMPLLKLTVKGVGFENRLHSCVPTHSIYAPQTTQDDGDALANAE
jgi:hypothetical protein